jgi:hypothetical protein
MTQSKLSYTNSRGDTVTVGDMIYTGNRYYHSANSVIDIREEIAFVTAIKKECGRWHIYYQPFDEDRGGTPRQYAAQYNRYSSDGDPLDYGMRPFKASEG